MAESLPHLIAESAARFADRPAIGGGDGWTSYRELDAQIGQVAALLERLALAGERVGLLLPNSRSFPLALYGVLRAGASAVMLNPLYSRREIEEYLEDSGAHTVITTAALAPLLPDTVRQLRTDALPEHLHLVERGEERALVLAGIEPIGDSAIPAGREAVVIYTAGTFGWARGARLTHGNLIANLRSTIRAMQIVPEDRVLAALPLIHAFGLTVTLDAPLVAGAAVLPLERFNPLRVLDLLEEEQITVFCGVPSMYLALLAAAEKRGVPQHALRVVICGGAPLPEGVVRRWEQTFGVPLREGYGLTEAGPVCLFNRVDLPNQPGTLGYPFPDVEVTIRAENGDLLPPGEVGEICVKGANVFRGYIGEDAPPELRGGILHTGDLGSVDAQGRFRFRGVLKPMFTRNGFNIYPKEVQRALEEDPGIVRVTACALPDPVRENELVLYVSPAPGAALTEDDVREICKERLAAYKQPGRVVIGGMMDGE
jgi:long-chain acyl-CoA synthetase